MIYIAKYLKSLDYKYFCFTQILLSSLKHYYTFYFIYISIIIYNNYKSKVIYILI